MSPAIRLIVANLDAESCWARATGLSPTPLAPAVLARISILGTLLSVLAPKAKQLWTPVPVDPACRRDVTGFPHPTLVTGALPVVPGAATLAWARATPLRLSQEALSAAAAANHKGRGRGLAQTLERALPGTTQVGSVSEALSSAAAVADWVVKAPFSASGRNRVRGAGPDPDATTRRRLARLFAAHEQLWIEPFVERLADFGHTVDANGAHGTHRLLTHAGGQVHGLATLRPGELSPDERATLQRTVTDVRDHLRARPSAQSYDGPLGIDAFRYRTAAGGTRFHPLVEINARHTFGHVFASLAPVAAAAFGPGEVPFALRLGAVAELALPSDAVALVGSADGLVANAWLERRAPDRLGAP